MQRIRLGNSEHYALVDDVDFPLVSRYAWHFSRGYAAARVRSKKVKLHVLLLGKRAGYVIDHRNRNGLDCRRSNLHHVDFVKNAANSKHRVSDQPLRGARWMPKSTKAEVRLGESARMRFGGFNSLLIAGMLRDLIAIDVYEESAVLNFPELRVLHERLSRERPDLSRRHGA